MADKGQIFQSLKDNSTPVEDFGEELRKQLLRQWRLKNDETEQGLIWKQQQMKRVFGLCLGSLIFAGVIILFNGFHFFGIGCFNHILFLKVFHLSDKVMVAVIAGVVVHVLGLYYVILKNLFPQRNRNK